MASFTVVYDACVLYPAALRDLLVELARTGLLRAKWSVRIHTEWINAVIRDRPDLDRARLERAAQLMNLAVLDCLVTGFESLEAPAESPRRLSMQLHRHSNVSHRGRMRCSCGLVEHHLSWRGKARAGALVQPSLPIPIGLPA